MTDSTLDVIKQAYGHSAAPAGRSMSADVRYLLGMIQRLEGERESHLKLIALFVKLQDVEAGDLTMDTLYAWLRTSKR